MLKRRVGGSEVSWPRMVRSCVPFVSPESLGRGAVGVRAGAPAPERGGPCREPGGRCRVGAAEPRP